MDLGWNELEQVLRHTRRALLYGPPATGKTFAAISAAEGTVYSVTLTEDVAVSELRGCYLPDANGGFRWHDGPALRAWREGSAFVVNEVDHGSGEVLSFLLALLDNPESARLTLPTGETVRPADGFRVVATMNGAPLDLPEALRSRFPVKLNVDQVNPAALDVLPEHLRGVASNTVSVELGDRRLDVRQWLEFVRLAVEVGQSLAGRAVFGPAWGGVSSALALSGRG